MAASLALAVVALTVVLVTQTECRVVVQYEGGDEEGAGGGGEFGRRRGEQPQQSDGGEQLGPPWLGLGVLSDMQQFFDNLRTNLDSLESLPTEQRDALLGKAASESEKDHYNIRPAASAAYLAMRNQRPSFKIRNFVESPEPVTLRGTNHYDPSLLWTGLGRRRR